MTRSWIRGSVFGIASALSYAACDSSAPTLGGETNWLKICTLDSECANGTRCLCGYCTKTCSGDDACESPQRACALSGSPAYDATCAGASPTPGICLGTCGSNGCAGALTCTSGFCTPAPLRDSGSGGSPGVDGASGGGGSGTGGLGRVDASTDRLSPPHDAKPEIGPLEATTITDGGCSTVGPWPASPTTFDAKCTPNCDAPSCGSICPTAADRITGMPCDTGCCASNTASVTVVPASITGAGGPAWTTVAASPNGSIYCGMTGGTSAPNPLPFSFAATPDPLVSNWPDQGTPDLGATVGDAGPIANAESPLFAFGKIQGKDVTYAAYTTAPVSGGQASGRFGIQDGTQWTFEDIPSAPIALAADVTGAPLVLVGDHVIRRNASNAWDSFCLPDTAAGNGADIAIDAAGAWYVARTGTDRVVRVSRRNSNGTWATEPVTTGTRPAFAAAVAIGAGTVHVAYTLGVASDAGIRSGGELHYARRVGTAWAGHAVIDASSLPKAPGETLSVRSVRMATDACGAPHFGVYVGGSVTLDAYYFRFTQAGWRGARFENTCDANAAGGIALTTQRAFLSFWSCAFQLAAVPLK